MSDEDLNPPTMTRRPEQEGSPQEKELSSKDRKSVV